MSVSFMPSMDSSVPHTFICACGAWRSDRVYPSRMEAVAAQASVASQCVDSYCDCIYVISAADEPEVNVSNGNAVDVLHYLGIGAGDDFGDSCVGTMSAEDFLSRVLIAEALCPADTGLVTMQVENVVYCGRPSDYLQARLTQLREVAEWSLANGRMVTWG